jgi:hypothetical protein
MYFPIMEVSIQSLSSLQQEVNVAKPTVKRFLFNLIFFAVTSLNKFMYTQCALVLCLLCFAVFAVDIYKSIAGMGPDRMCVQIYIGEEGGFPSGPGLGFPSTSPDSGRVPRTRNYQFFFLFSCARSSTRLVITETCWKYEKRNVYVAEREIMRGEAFCLQKSAPSACFC